jgi:chromosome segregation ATPase
VNKGKIIIIAAAGFISFTGMFGLAWFTTKTPVRQYVDSNQPAPIAAETDDSFPPHIAASAADTSDKTIKGIMTEKQLKSLVYEVREKIQQYNKKLNNIKLREQRLQTAHDMLKKDAENLDNMQVELASIIATLKSKRNELLKTRIEIEQAEKGNLMSIAATYDKMDAASASKILSNMCANQKKDNTIIADDGLDDAVKILHYMTERTKAKVLAELVNTKPELAAIFCKRLKQIIGGK